MIISKIHFSLYLFMTIKGRRKEVNKFNNISIDTESNGDKLIIQIESLLVR